MEEIRKRLLAIMQCSGVGRRIVRKMLQFDESLASVFTMTTAELSTQFGMSANHANAFKNDLQKAAPEKMMQLYNEENIHVMTIFDDDFPLLLKEIPDPPLVLYCKGNCHLLTETSWISIVGTRKPSSIGLASTALLTKALVEEGFGIVSGLAVGIDAKAHLTALQYEGATIAVLASGFHHLYPPEHSSLAARMVQHNLLLSEYPPHTKPRRWQFPERNRIISGLSPATVVIEAKAKSGSLITADQALEQNREVFAVPGPITEPRSLGTNKLIQQGAMLITSADDIINELKNNY